MRSFTTLTGPVLPLDRANVDTDAILAKQFMKSIRKSGYGEHLFDQWRYLDFGELGMDNSQRPLNLEFPLNDRRYAGANILLARENFGCGSSREHAAWALWDYGFRAVISPQFADIFYGNCFKNGILPITLDASQVDSLFGACQDRVLQLSIDLARQTVGVRDGETFHFEIDPSRKERLLAGMDEIALTLQKEERISEYEARRKILEPWLFPA